MLSNQKIKELQLWLSDKIHYYEEKANKADRLTTGLINNSIKVSFEEVQNKVNELLLESCSDLYKDYVLVQWPNSQEYMDKEWFEDEAILALGSEDKTGDSAYFIPKYLV